MNNFFETDDFSVLSMTEAINTLPVVPSKIGAMGLFQEEGIVTTTVGIEQKDNVLTLIPTAARGSMPEYKTDTKRTVRAIPVPHLPKLDTIKPETVQNLRAFGEENVLEAVASVVNSRLAALKADHELTWEYHRIGALQGLIKDADASSTVVDLFTEFGVSRTTVNWATATPGALRGACVSVRRAIESALSLQPYQRIHVFCSEGYWDALIASAEVKDAYELWMQNEFARTQNNQAFPFAGLYFEELRGAVGGTPFVPTNEAFAFPVGVPGLYQCKFAPAPFNETVNTIGKPYYAKQEPMRFNMGTEIYTCSNPLFLVTKPKVLVKMTKS